MQVPIEKEHIEWAGWFAAGLSVVLGCIGFGEHKRRLSAVEEKMVEVAKENYMKTEEYNLRHEEDMKLLAERHETTISRIDTLGDDLRDFVKTNRDEHNDITNHLISNGRSDEN